MAVLYIIATPIGNLADLSLRAWQVLGQVPYIACEDTRVTGKLLAAYELKGKKLLSCRAHNERFAAERIITLLNAGQDVAYLSDAGTPGISDPGNLLVSLVHEQTQAQVMPVPGASAMSTILSVCGMDLSRGFRFAAFLPRKSNKILQLAQETLTQIGIPILAFESPHRIQKSLNLLAAEHPEAQVCLGRELTKRYEEILHGSLAEIAARPLKNKGEYCLVLANRKK